jgi:iron(III) transport system substrate-binding protein
MVGELFARAEKELGFMIDVQYGGTPELTTRLLTEGDASPADIFFAQDSGHLGALASTGRLSSLDASLLENVSETFRDPKGLWLGTSGRLRVLVYDPARTPAESMPTSLRDLADPAWKGRLGWAPGNGSFQAHVSYLRAAWGEEETRTWLKGVKANAPKVFPKNSPQVAAVNDGGLEIGWVNHYYLHRVDPNGRKAANWSFPDAADAGNVMMVAGMGRLSHSDSVEASNTLMAWFVSQPVQEVFAQTNKEYPARAGVPTHADVTPLDTVDLAEVDQASLTDLGPTRAMLKELELL